MGPRQQHRLLLAARGRRIGAGMAQQQQQPRGGDLRRQRRHRHSSVDSLLHGNGLCGRLLYARRYAGKLRRAGDGGGHIACAGRGGHRQRLAITGGVFDLGTYIATVNGTASLSAGTVQDGTLAADAFFGQQATVSAVFEDNGSNSAPLTVGSNGAGNPLVLTAQNTFSDGTTINQGAALQLGDGTSGNDGSILGGVNNNGNLIFNIFASSPAYTFGNTVSGTGSLTTIGPEPSSCRTPTTTPG